MTPNDPITAQYAPPHAPPPVQGAPGASGDGPGWALLALPVVGGVAQAALPKGIGAVVAYAAVIATVVLIAMDARRYRQRGAQYVVGAILLWVVFYPLYMYRRSRWGAPNRLPFAIVAVLLFLAGPFVRVLTHAPAKTRAYVRCKPAGKLVGDGFDCSIEHRSGDSAARTCWDLVLTCASGPGGSAHACGLATPGMTTHVMVAYSAVEGATGCDELTKIGVENLTLTLE